LSEIHLIKIKNSLQKTVSSGEKFNLI
jgi:hypothetical protein